MLVLFTTGVIKQLIQVLDFKVERLKINIWGAISLKGPSEFVIIINKFK
jgi:hypothetical protein